MRPARRKFVFVSWIRLKTTPSERLSDGTVTHLTAKTAHDYSSFWRWLWLSKLFNLCALGDAHRVLHLCRLSRNGRGYDVYIQHGVELLAIFSLRLAAVRSLADVNYVMALTLSKSRLAARLSKHKLRFPARKCLNSRPIEALPWRMNSSSAFDYHCLIY